MKIDHFCHVYINHDNEMMWLGKDPEFTRHYVKKKYFHADIHGVEDIQSQEFLLQNHSKYTGETQRLMQDAADFGDRQFFAIIEKNAMGTHFYHFSTKEITTNMDQIYLCNMDLLKKFTSFFSEKINSLKVFSAWKNIKLKIETQDQSCQQFENNTAVELQKMRLAFSKEISKLNSHKQNLSPQQLKCMQLLTLGFSAKEIAQQLNLSYRTVESYLSCIKEIYAAKNIKALIAMYLKENI